MNETDFLDDDNILELIDEDGNSVLFDYVMTLEHEGQTYMLMSPHDNGEEAVIFVAKEEANDEMMLEAVTDEALLETLFDIYLENVEEDDEEE